MSDEKKVDETVDEATPVAAPEEAAKAEETPEVAK